MSVFALNHHYTPVFAFVYSSKQVVNTCKPFLKINIGHCNFVKILYFIVSIFHELNFSKDTVKDKRWKHKSNATVFHTVKGGAVPTSTHQNSEKAVNKT